MKKGKSEAILKNIFNPFCEKGYSRYKVLLFYPLLGMQCMLHIVLHTR